jgi:hypothetical protein
VRTEPNTSDNEGSPRLARQPDVSSEGPAAGSFAVSSDKSEDRASMLQDDRDLALMQLIRNCM